MAKLCELAEGYRVAAVQLKLARAALRVRMETMAGPERLRAARELKLLEGMLRQVREVGSLVQHYYEPGYWRDRKYVC